MLGQPKAQLEDWRAEPLSGLGFTAKVQRVSGTARDEGGRLRPWSAVVKVATGSASEPAGSTDHWKREALAYRSGLFDDLPGGVRAPRLYSVDLGDEVAILWLEDVNDALSAWSIRDFERVARCLGRFNGAYCVGAPLPSQEFLSSNWLAQWVEQSAPAVPTFTSQRGRPVLARLYPGQVPEVLLELWQERQRLLSYMSAAPQVLSHLEPSGPMCSAPARAQSLCS